MIDMLHLTLPVALLAGLAFGAGPCNVTCLPYLGPVFMGGEGIRHARKILLPFTLGRLSGYSMLGLAAGTAGQTLSRLLQSSVAGWVLGLAAILVGLRLILLHRPGDRSCQKLPEREQTRTLIRQPIAQSQSHLPAPLFMLGLGMALNPCVPLTAILAAAAASGSAAAGLSLGLTFGLGAVVIPTLVFGVFIAHFGKELRQHIGSWSRYLEPASGSMLILLGLFTAIGWVQP